MYVHEEPVRSLPLSRWTLRDMRDHGYTFGPYILPVDDTLTPRQERGVDATIDRYRDQPRAVLMETEGETISLYGATHTRVDRYSYPSSNPKR